MVCSNIVVVPKLVGQKGGKAERGERQQSNIQDCTASGRGFMLIANAAALEIQGLQGGSLRLQSGLKKGKGGT